MDGGLFSSFRESVRAKVGYFPLPAGHAATIEAVATDGGLPFSSLREILRTVAGNFTSEAGRALTIESVFGDSPPRKINDEVYEIHHPGGRPKLEIVFFHGLELGHYQDSYWKNWLCADHSHCWPKTWLVEDFHDARVLSVSFDSSLTQTPSSGRMDLYQITENLERSLIHDAKVGQKHCPVVLVGHSLGGMVMKALCSRANHSAQDHQQEFLMNLKGLFFYSTPHHCSMLFQNLRRAHGELMAELKVLDQHSVRLNSDFGEVLRKYRSIELRGVGENLVTNFGKFSDIIVPEGSARSDRYDKYHTVLANHFDISKPASKTDYGRYKFLVDFICLVTEEQVRSALKAQIACPPNQLESLAASLAKATDPELQTRATVALANLAVGPEPNREKIFSIRGLPEQLVQLVAQDENFDLAANAASVIRNLTSTNNLSLNNQIARIRNLPESLAASLPKDTNPLLQTNAAVALSNLTIGPESNRERIFSIIGLPKQLVQSMAQDQNLDLAANAASMINNLTCTDNLILEYQIVCVPKLLESLAASLPKATNSLLQTRAAAALANLASCHEPNREKIFNIRGLPDKLVWSVAQDQNFYLAAGAASVIQNLAATESPSLKDQIACVPYLLESLAASLPKSRNPRLQTPAAVALANLAVGSEPNREKIFSIRGLPEQLVQLVSQDEDFDLAANAASVIRNLTTTNNLSLNDQIARIRNLPESLATSLPKDTNPLLQTHAAVALSNLAVGPEPNRERIFRITGLPKQLVQSVAQDQNLKLAVYAARVIQNLTATESLQDQIACVPNLLQSLAESLSKTTNPLLQTGAAAALGNLAADHETNRKRIFSIDGLPHKLVQLVAQDQDFDLAANAARLIRKLATTKSLTLKDQIACVPNLLESLTASLSKATNPLQQTYAARALAKLAFGHEPNQLERIFSIRGLPKQLVQAVAQDQNLDLAANAVLIIQNLAATRNLRLKDQIACVPNLLENLASSLPKATNPELQTHAAAALANLAVGHGPNLENIFSIRGLPEQLVQSMAQDQNFDLAANAARMIWNLASTRNLSLKYQIACVPNLLKSLRSASAHKERPDLQRWAAEALANLGHGR